MNPTYRYTAPPSGGAFFIALTQQCVLLLTIQMTPPNSKWDIAPVQPGELVDYDPTNHDTSNKYENFKESFLNFSTQFLFVCYFMARFTQELCHKLLPPIVRFLWQIKKLAARYESWAKKNKPFMQIIEYLYSFRREDYWVGKTKTGRLQKPDGTFLKKTKP